MHIFEPMQFMVILIINKKKKTFLLMTICKYTKLAKKETVVMCHNMVQSMHKK